MKNPTLLSAMSDDMQGKLKQMDQDQRPEQKHGPAQVTSAVPEQDARARQEEKDREQSRELFRQAKEWMEATFPKSFNFQSPVPLKHHIHKDIKAQESPVSYRQRLKVLKAYLYSYGYLKAILEGEWRHDLEGNPVEPISKEQKAYTQDQLIRKKEIWNNRKKEWKNNKNKSQLKKQGKEAHEGGSLP